MSGLIVVILFLLYFEEVVYDKVPLWMTWLKHNLVLSAMRRVINVKVNNLLWIFLCWCLLILALSTCSTTCSRPLLNMGPLLLLFLFTPKQHSRTLRMNAAHIALRATPSFIQHRHWHWARRYLILSVVLKVLHWAAVDVGVEVLRDFFLELLVELLVVFRDGYSQEMLLLLIVFLHDIVALVVVFRHALFLFLVVIIMDLLQVNQLHFIPLVCKVWMVLVPLYFFEVESEFRICLSQPLLI